MEKFLAAVRNMFNVPDLRRRIFFTLGHAGRLSPGRAHRRARNQQRAAGSGLAAMWPARCFGVLDLFSGGNFRTISIFALGVTPYITASIILQLMTVVSPQLKKLQEEGEMGRQKINQWTRYLTVGLAGIQTSFVAHWLQVNGVGAPTWGFLLTTVLTLTTGTIFVMWLGEQITERGVGNGISLLIFAGIVIGLPNGVSRCSSACAAATRWRPSASSGWWWRWLLIIAFIVFVEAARRKIPVSYAKRHVGRQMVGGQQTTMPLKINMGGVIPVIFASSVLSMPQSLFAAFPPDPANPNTAWGKIWTFFQIFHASDPYYELIFLSLIIFFTFFYVSIVFNVEEVADNLRKHGGFMPGIRPGRATAEYLNTILTRLTVVGAIYLALVAFVPQFMLSGFKVARLPLIGAWLDSFVSTTPGSCRGFRPDGLSVLFWRHVVADSGGCGDGHGRPD